MSMWTATQLILALAMVTAVRGWRCTVPTECLYNGKLVAGLSPGTSKWIDCVYYTCNTQGLVTGAVPKQCPLPRCADYVLLDGECCVSCSDGDSCRGPADSTIKSGESQLVGNQVCGCQVPSCYTGYYYYGNNIPVPQASCEAACQTDADFSPVGLVPGGNWTSDNGCQFCNCNAAGAAECATIACAAIYCSNPITEDGVCCPVCPPECRYSNGTSVPNSKPGDEFRSNPCQPCVCTDNYDIVCAQVDCGRITCVNPKYTTGVCCPRCVEGSNCRAPSGATIPGQQEVVDGVGKVCHCQLSPYRPDAICSQVCTRGLQVEEGRQKGDSWKDPDGKTCRCFSDGEVKCELCVEPKCVDAVCEDGDVCLSCPNGNNCWLVQGSQKTKLQYGQVVKVDCYICSCVDGSHEAECQLQTTTARPTYPSVTEPPTTSSGSASDSESSSGSDSSDSGTCNGDSGSSSSSSGSGSSGAGSSSGDSGSSGEGSGTSGGSAGSDSSDSGTCNGGSGSSSGNSDSGSSGDGSGTSGGGSDSDSSDSGTCNRGSGSSSGNSDSGGDSGSDSSNTRHRHWRIGKLWSRLR